MLIHNRTKDFHVTDRCLFEIPDTFSLLSQLSRKSDWQFRIYAQCLMRSSMDYLVYFVTLTYSNYDLPRYRHSFLYTDFDFPCFSREDIRKFFRGIQQDLLRKYNVNDIDYICCSEFGKKGRPHYHILLLIPRFKSMYKGFLSDCDAVNSMVVHSLIVKHWSNIIPHKYDNDGVPLRTLKGWVLPGNPFGGVDKKGHNHKPLLVDRKNISKAVIYVSKYCTKDLDFYSNSRFRNALRLSKKSNEYDEYKRLNRVKPFLKTSQHFGECINDLVTSPFVPWAEGFVFGVGRDTNEKLYFGFQTPLYKKGNLKVPFYNRRKLLTERILVDKCRYLDYNTNTYKHVYTYATALSSLGKHYMPYEYRCRVDDTYFRISSFFSCHLQTEPFKNWLSANSANFDDDLSLLNRFNSLPIFRHLSVYSVCYKDRLSPTSLVNPDSCYFLEEHGTTIVSESFVSPLCDYDNYIKDSFEHYIVYSSFDSLTPFLTSNDYSDELFRLFPSCRFVGNESVDVMCVRARSYYCCRRDIIHNPLQNVLPPDDFQHMLFNNMPCFSGFDDVLYIVFGYLSYLTNQRLKAQKEKEDRKKFHKDLVYEN